MDIRAFLVAGLIVGSSAHLKADELPSDFYGLWHGASDEASSIVITAQTSHEAGYNCRFKRTRFIVDVSDMERHVASVDAICQEDGASPPPPENVHQVWALRLVDGKIFLVIATAGSIQIFKDREKY